MRTRHGAVEIEDVFDDHTCQWDTDLSKGRLGDRAPFVCPFWVSASVRKAIVPRVRQGSVESIKCALRCLSRLPAPTGK